MGTFLADHGRIINAQEALPIPVELMTLLWENQNPGAAFAPQNITLANDDYDFLLLLVQFSPTYDRMMSFILEKGSSGFINAGSTGTGGAIGMWREFARTNDTTYSVSGAHTAIGTTGETMTNSNLIPNKIYGFKKTVSLASGSNTEVEYKRVATGTAASTLKDTIKALTREEYMKSYLLIVDDALNAGNVVMRPEDGREIVKAFGGIISPYNAGVISRHYSAFYNIQTDTFTYKIISQPVSGSMSEQSPNITAWYLYTLKPV